ncbi:hypothetical protein ABZY36_16905 [Streptomyces sp. NPDC006627]|uniref:hypothetical protein n=1 Tax=Streptomyces sp. NPDC006627 TaxID=3154679 RepID=UPI0033A69EED
MRRNVLPARQVRTVAATTPEDGASSVSPTPIYDALVRQWHAQCREVPHPTAVCPGRVRADPQDLFRRG